jgi:hypothetical protein
MVRHRRTLSCDEELMALANMRFQPSLAVIKSSAPFPCVIMSTVDV